MIGTSDLRGPDTPVEIATSKYYQKTWENFARDPIEGSTEYGWPTYDSNGKTLIELGLNGSRGAVFADSDSFQASCQR